MTFDNQMKLPGTYFSRMAQRDYRNWNEALIRELTQNSVDATATEISVSWEPESRTLHFNDNGNGMNRHILENVFLQFGASHKAEGAVGGMGKAKELIIASWSSWSIRSNGILAQGRHNEYNISDCDYIKGTTITLTISSEMHMNEDVIKDFFRLCQISASVYLNGELLSESTKISSREIARIEGFGKLYKGSQSSSVCLVRANGVFMFSEWVEGNTPFIFEISNSAGCMSAGRDGFVGDYWTKFSKLLREMNFNGSSFKEYKAEIEYYVAENQEESEEAKNIFQNSSESTIVNDVHNDFVGAMDQVIQTSGLVTPYKYVPKVTMNIQNMSQDEINSDHGSAIVRAIQKKAKLSEADAFGERTAFYAKYLKGRFLFRTTDLSKGSQKHMVTVKSVMINFLFFGVVKECAKLMSTKITSPKNFVVGGFVDSDSDQEAFCQGEKILLNLEKIADNNYDEALLNKLIAISCHEIIHFEESHNERMASLLTELLPLMYTEHYSRFKEIFKKVKQMKPLFVQEVEAAKGWSQRWG